MRLIGLAFALSLTLAAIPSEAQRTHRIGVLSTADGPEWDAFRETLHGLGYVDGRNIALEYRWHRGEIDRLPGLAADLVGSNVSVIVTSAPRPTAAAKAATSSIPIVFVSVADPVALGFVASLGRPGGNITGFATFVPGGFTGKALELLREVIPTASRVAVLTNPTNQMHQRGLQDTAAAASALKLRLQILEARTVDDLEIAFNAATRDRADAMQVYGDPVTFLHRKRIAELALKSRLPTIYLFKPNVEAGGLLSYGPSEPDMLRRAATYVDKILKGARPADLPVEQPTKFELVINLKTAKALGLTIPHTLLLRADQVIE
jgi:putative tryptophan/tyrosine transport system substrate-binding protein